MRWREESENVFHKTLNCTWENNANNAEALACNFEIPQFALG